MMIGGRLKKAITAEVDIDPRILILLALLRHLRLDHLANLRQQPPLGLALTLFLTSLVVESRALPQ